MVTLCSKLCEPSVIQIIIKICVENECNCCVWTLKAIGVKFKVYVKDEDFQKDDKVDGFVQLLQLTPARNVSVANSTNILMYGIRSRDKTR